MGIFLLTAGDVKFVCYVYHSILRGEYIIDWDCNFFVKNKTRRGREYVSDT
jgi:hypothetical protein